MKHGSKPATARDMHLHELPWPQQELLALGNVDVEMRVTLSYFVQPNPGVAERGISGRYRYESHGLRFDVSRPSELGMRRKAPTKAGVQIRIGCWARKFDTAALSTPTSGKAPQLNWPVAA